MSNIFVPQLEDQKCAPSKKFQQGSCFSLDSLKKIANVYNKYNGKSNPIHITDSKLDLVKQLTARITTCNDQLCWLDINWIKQMNDEEIKYKTFRPVGPQGRFKWLNTTNINEVVLQYEDKHKDFKFLGAVPYDFQELSVLNIGNIDLTDFFKHYSKLGLVINLDEHWQRGSHWVGLYADLKNNKIYYFDSYGIRPKKKIRAFVKKIALWCYNNINHFEKTSPSYVVDTESQFMMDTNNKYEKIIEVKYNKKRHQYKNSECGVYSVNFILRMLGGETFNNICNNITNDDTINEFRKQYFRFK